MTPTDKPRRSRSPYRFAPDATSARAVWPLRLLVRHTYESRNLRHGLPEQVAELVGLAHMPRHHDPDVFARACKQRLEALESGPIADDTYLRNARALATELDLPEGAGELLAFLARRSGEEQFGEIVPSHRAGASDLQRECAIATGLDPAVVRPLFGSSSPLRRLGLLGRSPLARIGRFELDERLTQALGDDTVETPDLLRLFMRDAPAPTLVRADFSHLGARVDALLAYLRGALATRARGANVLLHGPAGTGKSELTRVLAAELGVSLFEVRFEDDDGDPCNGYHRLCGAGVCNRALQRAGSAMLVFDEIEDVFSSAGTREPHGRAGAAPTAYKAWTHRLLEEASVPMLWVGNSIEGLDAATLRRFDFVCELGRPPESHRRRIVAESTRRAAMPESVATLLREDARTTPAHVAQAARVANLVAAGGGDPAHAARVALEAGLALTGEGGLAACTEPAHYDLAFVHASLDLTELTEALRRRPRASLCLAGPPGTGKTAYVSHLARALDVPLHALRMSDLLDKYVGGTERLLARAFASARAAGALLFLDEVDGLLRDRATASQRWEVSQVNELLTQLEAFDGLFACATNLRDTLDAASLRRFSLKIDFLPLRADQRAALLVRHVGACPEPLLQRLAALRALTAGDFAAVHKRLTLLGREHDPAAWVEGLEAEHACKQVGARAVMGFA